MQWLDNVVDELIQRQPKGEILVESGGSPSGTYHIGHLRELITCDAIMLELRRRGRHARHIYFVDDFDAFRKVPINVPPAFEQYLGQPLCDIPAPGSGPMKSYSDFFMQGLIDSCKTLDIEVEFIYAHEKYRSGFFAPAIERCMERLPQIRHALETISNRQLPPDWTPIQVMESGRLKSRTFISIHQEARAIEYRDADGGTQKVHYDKGGVKLDWRLDWPARWWLLKIGAEPFGRDHASAGSSYDTGAEIMKTVYEAEPPMPVPYDFINMAGDTKKMSASKGTGLDAVEGSEIMPPEVIRYLVLRAAPSKRLYFDPVNGIVQLMDEFAALVAKPDKTEGEQQLLAICMHGFGQGTVSQVPFSHLVASYQAALKDPELTLSVIGRTEYRDAAKAEAETIRRELAFIDQWLQHWAPEEVKFTLAPSAAEDKFNDQERAFFNSLADKIAHAPETADGTWFHSTVYEFKDSSGLTPKDMFSGLYRLIIGKPSGPRAGWFLSTLPRDWLIKRLRFEV